MQNVEIGLVVRSISGHDKNEIYIISKLDKNFVYLINGKERNINNPKKKNVKHIIKVGNIKEVKQLIENNAKIDNSQIIKFLKNYR